MSRRQILVIPKSHRREGERDLETDDISTDPAMTAVIVVERASYPYEFGATEIYTWCMCRFSKIPSVINQLSIQECPK